MPTFCRSARATWRTTRCLKRRRGRGRPVLLKRGMVATIADLLRSAQLILDNGNPNVILCERGIRTFETAMRNTFDVAAIALLKQISHLPVIADPSHAAGHRELVPALARIAVAAGADGLLVEVHPNPGQGVERWRAVAGFCRIRRDDGMRSSRGWRCAGGNVGAARGDRRQAHGGRGMKFLLPCAGDCCVDRIADSGLRVWARLRHKRSEIDADIIVTAAPVYEPLAALRGRRAISQGRAIAAGS